MYQVRVICVERQVDVQTAAAVFTCASCRYYYLTVLRMKRAPPTAACSILVRTVSSRFLLLFLVPVASRDGAAFDVCVPSQQ